MRMLEGVKKIHFIGVAGVAMSAIAIELKEQGYIVTGSDDEAYDPVKSIIERKGILKKAGYDATFITEDVDLVVLGRHAFLDNPEYTAAKKKNIKIVSFPELLEDILKDYTVICVVGTYAKTTITAIITWILETAGEHPGYLIGGIPKNLEKSSASLNQSISLLRAMNIPAQTRIPGRNSCITILTSLFSQALNWIISTCIRLIKNTRKHMFNYSKALNPMPVS